LNFLFWFFISHSLLDKQHRFIIRRNSPKKVPNNQNHPHSGWFAQGLKAQVSSQRLKALAFSSFKPLCVRFSRCP